MPASSYADAIRARLARGPCTAREMAGALGVSQPTVSRALAAMGQEVLRLGAARSIQYVLRDGLRGLPDLPVYRVDSRGRIMRLGLLLAVRPDGFVVQIEGRAPEHSEGLPWWLFDMRPQGYLGRAYALRHAADLGLPDRVSHWTDAQALRALTRHGHDLVGNLLLGELAREHYLSQSQPEPLSDEHKALAYARLAREAARGDRPGSSAAGEQPKFTAWALTPGGPAHVLVKFSEPPDSPVSQRWGDLLLAEHLALQTLNRHAVAAAQSQILDHDSQRFLEVRRFDREGYWGRRGLTSLTALDAQFVGAPADQSDWPRLTQRLAAAGLIGKSAAERAQLLWAFGTLIGNTDMHNGNLSFLTDSGPPYSLAPAYDMAPMAFAPRSGGGLPEELPQARIDAAVPAAQWRRALRLAQEHAELLRLRSDLSRRYQPCLAALHRHIEQASIKIARLG
jgi:hypothetical protein